MAVARCSVEYKLAKPQLVRSRRFPKWLYLLVVLHLLHLNLLRLVSRHLQLTFEIHTKNKGRTGTGEVTGLFFFLQLLFHADLGGRL